MNRAKVKTVTDEPEPSSWRETRDLFPLDRLLRLAGWRIHARPRRGQPRWERGPLAHPEVLPQIEAAQTLGPQPLL